MRLDTRMLAGSLVMALACGAAGFYGVNSLGGALEETSGPAWQSAQGGMTASIGIGGQVLAVRNVLSDVDVESNRAALEQHRKDAVTALNSLDDAGLLDSARIDELRRRRGEYEASLASVLSAYDGASGARLRLDEQTTSFVELGESLEERADSAIEQFEETPDKPVTWKTGLQTNWDAADGGMHVRIGLLTKLYQLSRLRAGVDRETCLAEMDAATEFQTDGFHHLEESGLFNVPVDPASPEGATYEAQYGAIFRENNRLIDEYVKQLFTFQDASVAYESVTADLLRFLKDVEQETAATVDQVAANVIPTQRRAWLAIGVSLVLCMGASVYSALLITRTIRRPLSATVKTLKEISGGDLTQRVNVKTTGEMAELVAAVNHITEGYHATMKHITGSAETLTDASSNLMTTADDLASAADQASQRSSGAASAAEQMSVTMGTVSHMTDNVSTNVNDVAGNIHEMSESIAAVATSAEQSAGIARRAAATAEESNARVAELGEAAKEISEVISVIQEIAEQTNLLALNATIESARAGESGKGFAVVAQEVKQLAQQTTEATGNIRSRIENMLDTTNQAISSIQGVGEVISEVNGAAQSIATAVDQQTDSTRGVTTAINLISESAQALAGSVSESAVASREISQNVGGVDTEARRTSTGAGTTREASSRLMDLAGELQTMVADFKV